MKKLIQIIIIFCGLLMTTKAYTQVLPPEFECIKNDTLFWNVPVNICGAFVSYRIFFSETPNGPYTLLDEINTAGQNLYFHANPGGITYYYYMESNFSCPGEPVLQSDTLDNNSPIVAPIQSISVNNNNIELTWETSPSPEVHAYIVYRNTDIGTVPIDTVFGTTSYIDVNATPGSQSESYYIIATDPCGNTSIFDLPHQTIFLENTLSVCEQTFTLNWNLYENWPNGIENQEVWLGINGNPRDSIISLSPTDTSYIFENVNDGDTYCFSIKTQQANGTAFSFSNEVCMTVDVVQPMRSMIIKNVSVDQNNQVELDWQWQTDAEIHTVNILRSTDNTTYETAITFPAPVPLVTNNSEFDSSIDPNSGKWFYTIQTVDDCDSLAHSNYGSTIFLSGIPQSNLSNDLNWTDFDILGGEVLGYDLYRIVDGDEYFITVLDANETIYTDKVDPNDNDESNVCYYVIADAKITFPDSSSTFIRSRSNTFCVEQLTKIYTPNAFAPSGVNKEFKPLVVFNEGVDYQMVIYNRWGGKVFETTDISKGWNGRKEGQEQPEGAYVYYIKLTQPNGRIIEDKGVLILMW